MSTSNKPVFATYWDPMYGPSRVRVYGHGSKPGYMRVSEQRPGRVGERQVPKNALKFEFGPDAKKFGLPYKDPYAGIDRNDDIKAEGASSLKEVIRLLREADKDDEKEEGEDSLDSQIDKYLTNYEAEAKNAKNESLDFRMLTRRFLIEAEEEDTDDKEGEDAVEEPEKLTADDLNMKSFVSDVMRLVENYDNLLEVRNTILRRAVNFIVDKYEGDVADSFKEELLESYGIEIGKSKSEIAAEEFQAPKAGAAGPMSGGGA